VLLHNPPRLLPQCCVPQRRTPTIVGSPLGWITRACKSAANMSQIVTAWTSPVSLQSSSRGYEPRCIGDGGVRLGLRRRSEDQTSRPCVASRGTTTAPRSTRRRAQALMLCCRLWEAASRFLAPQPERACSLAGTWIGGLPPARCRSAVPRYAWAHWAVRNSCSRAQQSRALWPRPRRIEEGREDCAGTSFPGARRTCCARLLSRMGLDDTG
jgi:hypothetical protein